jgi:hypothetical protein
MKEKPSPSIDLLFAVFIPAGSSFKLFDYCAVNIIIFSMPSSTKTSSLLLPAPLGTCRFFPGAKFVFQHFYLPVTWFLTATCMKRLTFRNMITCRLIDTYGRFGSA